MSALFENPRAPITLDTVISMLSHVSSDDRDTWIKIGGALKDEFGDAGFGSWIWWSATSDRYVEKDARAVWQSLGRNGKRAGVGTIVYLARQGGWNVGCTPPERPQETRKAPPPQEDTSAYAIRLWLSASYGDGLVGTHPYAVKKGINWGAGAKRGTASGRVVGTNADCLIVPIRTDATGKVQGVQCINAEGKKQTLGRLTGGCLVLGDTRDLTVPWYVSEGWASAASVVFHHHSGRAVCAAAFGKHNLRPTAEILERVFNPPEITILREVD